MNNRKHGWILGAALVASSSLAVVQSKPAEFRDSTGNMVVRDIDSFSAKVVDKDTRTFTASGNPLHGEWKSQGIVATCKSIVGELKLLANKSLEIQTATLTGGVKLDRTSTGTTGKSAVLNVTSNSAEYNAKEELITANGSVKGVQTDPTTNETVTMTGSKGTFKLKPFTQKLAKGESSITTATIEGPVALKLVRRPVGSTVPTNLDASGDRLVYNDAAKTLTISGKKVVISGDDPAIVGNMVVTDAILVITLDELGQAKSIDIKGRGETSIRDKDGAKS